MFKCQECGKKFKDFRAAERAVRNGCPKCGGVDVDVDTDTPPKTWTYVQRDGSVSQHEGELS